MKEILFVIGIWLIMAAIILGMTPFVLNGYVKLKRWHRRRKTDRRIIKQAKAAGVWEKPLRLGGRALELKAWKKFKIKRQPGETDADLRRRWAKIEIVKQTAEEHGRKIKKIKTDGYNVQIILCDETPPREGGHSNEQS